MCHPVVTVHTYVPKTTDFNYFSAVEWKVIAQIWSIACEECIQFHSGSEKQNSGKKDELNQLITLLSWSLPEAAASNLHNCIIITSDYRTNLLPIKKSPLFVKLDLGANKNGKMLLSECNRKTCYFDGIFRIASFNFMGFFPHHWPSSSVQRWSCPSHIQDLPAFKSDVGHWEQVAERLPVNPLMSKGLK